MSRVTWSSRAVAAFVVPAAVVVTALLASCQGEPAAAPAPATATASSPAASPSTSATPAAAATIPAVPPAPSTVTERCGGPEGPQASAVTVRTSGGRMPGFVTGDGGTVAVLLHQTTGDGSCGWWPYASWLVTQHPVRALAVDLCGYGRSSCTDALSDRPVRQVDAAVRWARAHGASRVVLVGASMGGAVALDAAATLDVDAVVDLSGPYHWPDTDTAAALPRLRVPTLIAVSDVSDHPDHEALQQQFDQIPATHKRFVSAQPGHGYSLLTAIAGGTLGLGELAEPVADWVQGRYDATP